MRILVTGKTGRLGRALVKLLSKDYKVIAPTRKEMDIKIPSTIDYIKKISPDVIIHTAAVTSVDYCEKNKKEAYDVNVKGTFFVALGASLCNAKMVYVSTDYVFNGEKNSPYKEWDETVPVNYYGFSKLKGEEITIKFVKKFFVVRTAWLFGSPEKDDFVDVVLKYAKEEKEVRFTEDHIGSPSYVYDVADAIKLLIETDYYGIYHIVNKGETTRKGFAEKIFKIKNMKRVVKGVKGEDVGFIAKRPFYTALSCELFEQTLKKRLRPWEDALADYLKNTCKD